jgi:hypothetical protein
MHFSPDLWSSSILYPVDLFPSTYLYSLRLLCQLDNKASDPAKCVNKSCYTTTSAFRGCQILALKKTHTIKWGHKLQHIKNMPDDRLLI